jgi:hypothetical protein
MNIDRFIAIIAILIALYTVYRDDFVNKNPILDVKTFPIYKYKVLTNKYQVRFKLKNIGENSIIGTGNKKNLLDHHLTIYLQNVKGFELKEAFHIFPLDYSQKSFNKLALTFKQWMPYDFVEFIFDVELEDETQPFKIFVSKHQIKDGKISYSNGKIDEISFYINDVKIYTNKDN